ncbi:EthD domain-containing protein [Fusarium oxysporum]|nr:EthD domain-containing protein [Fusarium oxysporum]
MNQIASLLLLASALSGNAAASPKGPPSDTGLLQMVTYVKRNPNMTLDEFWQYWDTQHAPKVIPLATHFGIARYQQVGLTLSHSYGVSLCLDRTDIFFSQVRVAGKIVPTDAGATEPVSNNLVDFDGIAMFLYESADVLIDMLSHPYYVNVVEPDEHVFIDKSAHGNSMVATYIGEHIDAVDDAKSVWKGDKKTLSKYQKLFKEY